LDGRDFAVKVARIGFFGTIDIAACGFALAERWPSFSMSSREREAASG
jgi:hypothetical protein